MIAETVNDRARRIISIAICVAANIEPVDSFDGSENWWLFQGDAQRLIDDLKKRGFFQE